jgi:hypothetical protein
MGDEVASARSIFSSMNHIQAVDSKNITRRIKALVILTDHNFVKLIF